MNILLQAVRPQTTLSLCEINLADPDFWLRDDFHGALAAFKRHPRGVIGAGFIRLEPATSAAKRNMIVTVMETAPRCWSRSAMLPTMHVESINSPSDQVLGITS